MAVFEWTDPSVSVSDFVDIRNWPTDPIPPEWESSSGSYYLRTLNLFEGLVKLWIGRIPRPGIEASDSRQDLLPEVEIGLVITLTAGSDVLVFAGPNHPSGVSTDPEDPYAWRPANQAEIIDWQGRRSDGDSVTARLEYPPPLSITPSAIDGNLSGELVGSLALGQVPLPPLVLTDFDQTDLQIDFLALIEAGLDITGDNRTYYADANRPPVTGLLLDGELGVSSSETLLTRFQYVFQGSNAGQIRLNDNDVPVSLSWSDYFSGEGADLTLYVQTEDSLVSIPVAGNIASSGGGFVRLSVPTAAGRAVLNSIEENDRFILAAARPPIVTPIEIIPGIIEGDLAGEVVAGVSLGQAPILISPSIIDGGLSGDITAILSLGQAPSTPPIEITPTPIDGDLSGELVGALALGQAPPVEPPIVVDPADLATLQIPVFFNAPTFHLIGPSFVLPAVLIEGDRDDITIAGNSFIQHGAIQLDLVPALGSNITIDFNPDVEARLLMRFSYGGVERVVIRGTGGTGLATDEPYFINHAPESGAYLDLFNAISGTDTPIVLRLEYVAPVFIIPAVIQGSLSGEVAGRLELSADTTLPPIAIAPPAIDGGLSGEISANLALGRAPGRLLDAFVRSAFGPETDEVWLILLTLSHPDLTDDIRVVHNPETITSRGQDYIGFAFELTLPSDTEDRAPVAELRIDNVSREIAEAVRSISSAPTVTIEIIRAADPDSVEISLTGFTLRNVRWDALAVSGSLALDDISIEPYPAGSFTPASFPGLF